MIGATSSRVASAMRATGRMHLGHYRGVLHNWLRLQNEHDCFFSVADVHALTTHYGDTQHVAANVHDMIVDWLAAGIDPERANIFVQSHVPEIAELQLLLGMITPLGWLERVPTYKDQIGNLHDKDLHTFGFLGYPVLMAADVLIFKAELVPVGRDQLAHVELIRAIARRFNYLYGRDEDYRQKAEDAVAKSGKKTAAQYRKLQKQYQEQGDEAALKTAKALVASIQQFGDDEKERLYAYLEDDGKIILPQPQPLLTDDAALPGLDGRKMSKSYHNTVMLRDSEEDVTRKIKTMPTDPARVKRSDPGEPEKCPVWPLHQVYSDDETQQWVQQGCRSAGIGCLDCKAPLIKAVLAEQQPLRLRAEQYDDPERVRYIIRRGADKTREIAREVIEEVREAVGLYSAG